VELLAGVHRTNAYETAGLPEVPAYVLDPGPGPQVEYLIAVEDNTTHGAALTHDERIEHALRMVDLGFTRAEAARRSGLNANKVYSAVKVRHSGKVLAGFGLATQWAKLPASSQWRLATASQGDTEVLAEAVMTAVGAHLVSKQVFELASVIGAAVKAGGKTGGTAAALQAIEDYEIQVDTSSRAASRWTASSSSSSSSSSGGGGGGGGRGRSAVLQARSLCRDLLALDPDDVLDSCLPGDAAVTLDLVRRAALHLARLGPRFEAKARAAEIAARDAALTELRGA